MSFRLQDRVKRRIPDLQVSQVPYPVNHSRLFLEPLYPKLWYT